MYAKKKISNVNSKYKRIDNKKNRGLWIKVIKYLSAACVAFLILLAFGKGDIYAASLKKIYMRNEVVINKLQYREDGIRLVWKKIPDSMGYYIYRKEDNGKWKKYDKVSNVRRYTDMYTETGVKYEYAVCGYTYINGQEIVTKLTSSDKVIVGIPEKIQNVTARYKGVTKAKIKWEASDEVSGYYIYRQIGDDEWEKIADIQDCETTSYNDDIVECKKMHKYKIIPYEIVNDTIYEGYFDITAASAFSDSGIDVSYHNGKIMWSDVKDDGVDFAFIRIGRGEPSIKQGALLDTQFARNMKFARKNGIKVGVYFYSCARSVAQAEKEAKFVLKHLKEYGEIDYPVVYDFESMYRRGFKYKRTNTKMIQAFCKIITDAGYEAMIYSDYEMLSKYTNYEKISKYGIWVAYWTYDINRCPIDLENVWIWQYSDKGRFNGISEYTDKNVRFIN